MEPNSVARGVKGIINYLTYKKVLSLKEVQETAIKLFPKSQIKKYYASFGGMVEHKVTLGTQIKAGQLLYQILCFSSHNQAPKEIKIYAENSGLVFDLSINQAVNQGEYILAVMGD